MKTLPELAHEAAIGHPDYDQDDVPPLEGEDLAFFQRFADLIRADEREASTCAAAIRLYGGASGGGKSYVSRVILLAAEEIRARGNK